MNDIGFLRSTDRIRQEAKIMYVENTPGDWFKNYRIKLSQRSHYTYNGTYIKNEFDLKFNTQLNSNWHVNGRFGFDSDFLDTHRLRGGPAIKIPYWTGNLSIRSNSSQDFAYWTTFHLERSFERGVFRGIWPGFTWKRGSRFQLNFNLGYNQSDFDAQWMGKQTHDTKPISYFVGQLNRDTFSSTIRLDYNFTPNMSLAYYGNFYVSSGTYSNYKRVINPQANIFNNRFHHYSKDSWIRNNSDDLVLIDGNTDQLIEDPDFNYRSFRSNLVFRWEYKPGSTFYLVWSHERENEHVDQSTSINADFDCLLDTSASNTILMKLSYWFSI